MVMDRRRVVEVVQSVYPDRVVGLHIERRRPAEQRNGQLGMEFSRAGRARSTHGQVPLVPTVHGFCTPSGLEVT